MAFGHPGTISSIVMRFVQILFGVLSIFIMIPNMAMMSAYIVYRGLLAALIINCSWGLGLLFFDIYALYYPWVLPVNRVWLTIFVVGDMLVGFLTFIAASTSAGVALLLSRDVRECIYLSHACRLTAASVALAFIAWFFTAIKAIVMLWLHARLSKSREG